jgi:glycerol-3-phosphate dehydrogenase subunit C
MEADFEAIIRSVFDTCADCDTCRFLMNEDCLFFPELYRLVDWEKESGQVAPGHELKRLVELCTLCGLCPCPNIRNDIIKAKVALVKQNGMPLGQSPVGGCSKIRTHMWHGARADQRSSI